MALDFQAKRCGDPTSNFACLQEKPRFGISVLCWIA